MRPAKVNAPTTSEKIAWPAANAHESTNNSNQLDEIKEYVSASVLKVAEIESADITHNILIPRQVGDSVYEISLTNQGLTVRNLLTGEKKFSTLYSLNKTHALSGNITSITGKVTINKKANQIIIK